MPNIDQAQSVIVGNLDEAKITIAATEQLSSAIYCYGNSILALQLDASFTPGDIVFFSSIAPTQIGTNQYDGFYQVTDGDSDLIVIPLANIQTAITNKNAYANGIQIPLDPAIFSSVQWLQIGCSVAQASDQTIKLVMGPVLGS
jgi:hypothetical protein